MENDIQVTFNDDNSLTIEWDETNPKYAFLNDLTSEELSEMIISQLKKIVSKNDEQL